jgi:hypothetical protein
MASAPWLAVCKRAERGVRLDTFVLMEKLVGLERARELVVANDIFLIVQVESGKYVLKEKNHRVHDSGNKLPRIRTSSRRAKICCSPLAVLTCHKVPFTLEHVFN